MRLSRILAIMLMIASEVAYAHPGHAMADGFANAFLHPFTGLDHLLGILGVGFLAARQSKYDALPMLGLFAVSIWLGMTLGASSILLSYVDMSLAVGLVAIGLAMAVRIHLPQRLIVGLTVILGWLHGLAHSVELSHQTASIEGMLMATLLLLSLGYLTGVLITHKTIRHQWLAVLYVGFGLFLLAS